jgi:hypothetical protein
MLKTMKLTADFETTTDENDCRVWAYGTCEIGNPTNFTYGNNIDDFLRFCERLDNPTVYFHNLKFDGEFIMVRLFELGYRHVTDKEELDSKTFSTLISNKGQFYSMKIVFRKKGKRTRFVQLYDSLKILPFTVDAIAKGFNLQPPSSLPLRRGVPAARRREEVLMGNARVRRESDAICGVVEAVYHAGANFSAGLLRTDGAPVRFAGKIFVRENDPVSFRGCWEQHPKYGRQFAVECVELETDLDSAGLANYLANHPKITGIGPAKARLISEAFGTTFDRAIRENPSAVARAAKVSIDVALNLQHVWIEASALNGARTHLAAYGLTHFQITTLVGKFGNQVVSILEENPYLLI